MKTEFILLKECVISVQNTTPSIDGIEQPMETILVLQDIPTDCIQDDTLVLEITPEQIRMLITELEKSLSELNPSQNQ